MSVRFPEDRKGQGATPDSTLSCLLCQAQMQDARVLPGCLHSFCKACLEKHANGQPSFLCPASSCNQTVSQSIDSLPANSFFTSLATLDSDPLDHEIQKLTLATRPLSATEAGSVRSSLSSLTGSVGGGSAGGSGRIPSLANGGFDGGPTIIKPQNQFGLGRNLASQINNGGAGSSSGGSETGWSPDDLNWRASAGPRKEDGWGQQTNLLQFNPLGENWKPIGEVWSNNGNHVGLLDPNPPPHLSLSHSAPGAGVGNKICGCEENQLVTAHCRDCAEDLCESCVGAHQRVKLTRDHALFHYQQGDAARLSANPGPAARLPTNPGPTASFLTAAGGHQNTPVSGVGPVVQTPTQEVYRVYLETAEKSKKDNQRILAEAKAGLVEFDKALGRINTMERDIIAKKEVATRSISQVFEQYHYALNERERALINRVDRIHHVKFKSLEEQQQQVRRAMLTLGEIVKKMENQILPDQLAIEYNTKYSHILLQLKSELGSLDPREDDKITFVAPDPGILANIATVGLVASSGFPKLSKAEGDGLKKGVLGRECRFIVCVNDHLGEPRLTGKDNLQIHIQSPDMNKVWMNMSDPVNGQYRVVWRPHCEGDYYIHITLNGVKLAETPYMCSVRNGRDYRNVGIPVLEFGREGSGDGELCRPWGVCCTKDGLIVVADRSNNRIQLYNKDGTFHSKFGVEGKGPGQFNKPASVCCDRNNNLIVTDKDNHRVQIFTITGNFLMKFGEKGTGNGQFNYPWDVACNSKNQILISDTRNHRLQLFSPNGEFINKYGFDGPMWKHFDSPRGVCFAADDQTIVTDFNNHRLLVIKADFANAQYLGDVGSKDGQFTRPNGVTVDDEGNIIVADSRNHRIQVFTSSGVFLKRFGSGPGAGVGEMNTPSGVCMTPDGLLVVVDFANSRIQIF